MSVTIHDDFVLKTQDEPAKPDRNHVLVEADIINRLNCAKCPCVPQLLDAGDNFLKIERKHSKAPPNVEDSWLSFLAVAGLGYIHGDLLARNVINDGEIHWLIDFDRAIPASGNLKFDVEETLREEKWIPQIDYFIANRLDLFSTTLAKSGSSTIGCRGIYHDIDSQFVYLKGERPILNERLAVLNRISFERENVLDVGCNTGSVARHIGSRGARYVNGIEICRPHALLGQILNCVFGIWNVLIEHGDASTIIPSPHFDTVCIFSVLHHIKQMRLFASRCIAVKRVLVECRLDENSNHSWKFSIWQELFSFLESLFTGFKFNKDYGCVDRNRHIIELIRR